MKGCLLSGQALRLPFPTGMQATPWLATPHARQLCMPGAPPRAPSDSHADREDRLPCPVPTLTTGCAHLPARRHRAALQPAPRGRARCLHLRQVSVAFDRSLIGESDPVVPPLAGKPCTGCCCRFSWKVLQPTLNSSPGTRLPEPSTYPPRLSASACSLQQQVQVPG